MMGVPAYVPLPALSISLARDERSYAMRLEEFGLKVSATARSATREVGARRALAAKGFLDEVPASMLRTVRDSFDLHDLEAFQHRNHGNHSFGDPSQLMSSRVAFVAHADIMKGLLFHLLFFQYLAPGSTLVCIHHGATGAVPVPAGLEAVAQHFAWPHDIPTARFLRVDRHWQSQVSP